MKDRWPWTFEVDWTRRVVYVERELANKQFARIIVPFENVAWIGCPPRS